MLGFAKLIKEVLWRTLMFGGFTLLILLTISLFLYWLIGEIFKKIFPLPVED